MNPSSESELWTTRDRLNTSSEECEMPPTYTQIYAALVTATLLLCALLVAVGVPVPEILLSVCCVFALFLLILPLIAKRLHERLKRLERGPA